MDPIKLLFERPLQHQLQTNKTKSHKPKANLRMCRAYRMLSFGRLNAGNDPVSPFALRLLNEQTVSAKTRRNDANITKKNLNTNARIYVYMCACVRAYTSVNEGNAFKLDSENADEIVKGERNERSLFESQRMPVAQSEKLPEAQLNVEFARHTEAFQNRFSETQQNHSETRATFSARCCVCVCCVL
jgi:hypothetical protein